MDNKNKKTGSLLLCLREMNVNLTFKVVKVKQKLNITTQYLKRQNEFPHTNGSKAI